ncbi:MAG: MBL fold hydrolase [Spirochaetes bacterium GWD1_61_31]|nr:MAG: MBL fold hydrolase [Spirochaetes bacterium GWB1_60_80]OHD31114.1 MAG: MBL fold hydrolase [Spirochaetes bacterium GWC1_61_12]OHD35800.1 MAG: MBL fold hydrolase [Spirochaetes bacterium GWD1_61_31]OHD46742.1 MAG: MBL fold hydrolase [Spirochaetes bacterium GWE1_60_18]OHD61193.1 MAG: MBL fold hydrolase [Spirochaetes bacterium GWF1_60_12]HAP43049.1 MBL fold hydrolase [Spirochaetaceae bacterium]
MKKALNATVSWVGKVDWELARFHGDEYSTHKGSSYNSYVVEEGQTVLIDTVWKPFAKEFVDNLEAEGLLAKLDAIIAQHAEIDHSGALPELLRRRPDLPIYCTANGIKSLKGHYHADWDFRVVKTGDEFDLGNGKKLIFIEAPMLHWPDSMFSYMTGDAILFSNDAFGQHLATEKLFNDLVDQDELFVECIKYYANILTPFSALVDRKIQEVLALGLPVAMIATSHGVIWRDNPTQIVLKYLEWARAYQEDRVTILYDTMWEGTRALADALARAISQASPQTAVVAHCLSKFDKNDALTDVFRSKAVLIGSPTINKGVLTAVAGLLEELKGLRFKGKRAAAFGTYGWSGESVNLISEALVTAGFEVVDGGFRALWNPDAPALVAAAEYGKAFAAKITRPAETSK